MVEGHRATNPTAAPSADPDLGSVGEDGSRLTGKAKALYDEQVSDPNIKFVINGNLDQSLVALGDRCVIVKPGFKAGASFGGRVTTFHYADITGIELNTGLAMGVLEVLTPSYQGTADRDFWSLGKQGPAAVSNCLPINKAMIREITPRLADLRRMVVEAKRPTVVVQQPANSAGDLVGQIRELKSLLDAGVLSEAEFEQAKAKLLQ